MKNGSTASFDDVKAIKNSKSGLALLCLIEGKEHWIPHSTIHDDSEVYEPGHEGKLVISEWLAIEKGLV